MTQKGRLNLLDREAYHFLFKKSKIKILKSFTQNLISLMPKRYKKNVRKRYLTNSNGRNGGCREGNAGGGT
jgi:hypothetical protein